MERGIIEDDSPLHCTVCVWFSTHLFTYKYKYLLERWQLLGASMCFYLLLTISTDPNSF